MNILSSSNLDLFDDWLQLLPEKGGIILINKPIGITSFELIKQLKKHFKGYKIGHSGTLDPLASGLMLVAIGKATKLLNQLTTLNKEYIGTIKLGVTTASLDRETPEIGEGNLQNLNESLIYETAKKFIGKFEQKPPIYSAVKIDGQSAYKLVRNKRKEDEQILKEPSPRLIEVKFLVIKDIDLPFVHFQIYVSKGFYVRKFAEDFAKELGTIGYLYKLERIKIDQFSLNDSIELQKLLEILQNK